MTPLEIFEKLAPLHDDPEAFKVAQAELDEWIVNDVCSSQEQRDWYLRTTWVREQTLRKYKDPVARMNKAVEIVDVFKTTLKERYTALTGEVTDE